MTITVRPDSKFLEITETNKDWAFAWAPPIKAFCLSLGLDPEKWQEDQTCELKTESGAFEAFGIHIPVEGALLSEPIWNFAIGRSRIGLLRFCINGRLVAASLGPFEKPTRELLDSIPNELRYLSLGTDGPFGTFKSLTDISPLSRLTNLWGLHLDGFVSLTNLTPLAALLNLKSLHLVDCNLLTDISPLSGLVKLTELSFVGNPSFKASCLKDIRPLSRLVNLTSLNLSGAAVTDSSPLRELVNLTSLDLSNSSLTDADTLSGLVNLTRLNLGNTSFNNISALSGLVNLTNLSLGSDSLTNVSPLSGLVNLTSLSLGGKSLTDLSPLSGLTNLTNLSLGDLARAGTTPLSGFVNSYNGIKSCAALIDLTPLSSLFKLTRLNLSHCSKIVNIFPLSEMVNLTGLDLSHCFSLADIHAVSGLANLTELHLLGCNKLTDFRPLTHLVNLTRLDLRGCEGLNTLDPLSGLVNLKYLNLKGCESIQNLRSLSALKQLQELDITDLFRLSSIEPLRDINSLRILESTFHPGLVAEVLVRTATCRGDIDYIDKKAAAWLQEAELFDDDNATERERLAITLGEALSMLGTHGIIQHYETFLKSHPEFSAAPWKAWFLGTRQKSGFGTMRDRINATSVKDMTVGAIGGACYAMPDDTSIAGEQDWARNWLRVVELQYAARASVLKRIAPNICLALARLGEKKALDCWLERFTDPSDPGSLDPLQAAIAQWQIERGKPNDALAHAAMIQSCRERDPLLAALTEAWMKTEPDRAGETLLMIETPAVRRDTSLKLAKEPSFTRSAGNIHLLVVAVGNTPEALGELVRTLGSSGHAELLLEIASLLKADEKQLFEWRITRLETFMRQLREN